MTRNRIIISLLFAVIALSAMAQDDTSWSDHMSTLKPDSMPKEAKEDTRMKTVATVDIGHGLDGSMDESNNNVDTAHQIVLLIGDSMLDGLGNRFADYAAENGYEFHGVEWYGSNTMHWATKHDLEYQIKRLRPTFIIISLGYNDLGYYDFTRRKGWIKKIIEKIGDIPFVWIGPLPRRRIRDRRIVGIIRECVGSDRFFDSSKTYCKRIDGNHPTFASAARWTDDIAKWMSTPGITRNPIRMDYPSLDVYFHADERHNFRYKGRRL